MGQEIRNEDCTETQMTESEIISVIVIFCVIAMILANSGE